MRGFGSDNFSGVLPEVFGALQEVSCGHQPSYGNDIYTEKAVEAFRRVFGNRAELFFVYNGTGANIVAISPFVHSYNAVICAETAHIHTDECGAIQKQTGCQLLTVPASDGKLTVGSIESRLHGFGDQHHSQPALISLTQCTELGTVYTPREIREICDFAHARGLYVHVDGARLANAVAFLGCDPKEITVDAGVDVLSFGGTKNGLMFGEAVIFFTPPVGQEVKYIRKQSLQLHSKSRFIAAQFSVLLQNGLWLRSASHANAAARKLAAGAAALPGVRITQKVEGNEVFAILPGDKIEALQQKVFFYVWNRNTSEVRWVCSFDTTEEDVDEFLELLRKELV